MQIVFQDPGFTASYYSSPINHRTGRDLHIGTLVRFNGADKTLDFIFTPSHMNDLYSKSLIPLHVGWGMQHEKGAEIHYFSRGLSYLIPQTLYRESPMFLWSSPGCPPWLGCPYRDSCTLGTCGHNGTSSRYPCRQIHPLHYKLCSWEQPAQSFLSSSLEGSPASL